MDQRGQGPMLPISPEPLEQLQARYHLALDPLYVIIDEKQAEWHNIGKQPKHCFDFPNGLRLIISRERMAMSGAPPNEIIIHVSASFDPSSRYFADIKAGLFSLQQLHTFVRKHFLELSADTRPLEFIAMTVPKGVPHYAVKEGVRT